MTRIAFLVSMVAVAVSAQDDADLRAHAERLHREAIVVDYGYTAPAPEGLEHIGKLGAVTYELLKRGYDEETIRKVLGENTLRVMAEAERVAAEMR